MVSHLPHRERDPLRLVVVVAMAEVARQIVVALVEMVAQPWSTALKVVPLLAEQAVPVEQMD